MNVRSRLLYVYVALSAIYAATFLFPRQVGAVQLDPADYRWLSLTVLIPQLIIWFIAFYGYAKLRGYNTLIAGTPDGKEVAKITDGVMILAIGLPANAIASGLLQLIGQQLGNPDGLIILRNYIALIIPLLGFICISRGAHGLGKLAKQRPRLRTAHLMAIVYAIIAALYCFVTFSSDDLQAIYHLPMWLVALTITAPYLYTWHIGMQAAYEIHLYSKNAPGRLYRRSWNVLASGIAATISTQIILQYASTVTVQFTSLRVLRLLILVYVILATFAIGYTLIALGAKRLQKIEEV